MKTSSQPHTPHRHEVTSGTVWEAKYGYVRAVRSSKNIHVAGTTSVTPAGNVIGEGDAYAQTRYIFDLIRKVLHELKASLTDVVRTRMYVVNIDLHADAVGKAHGEVFTSIRPAATMVGVAGLIRPELLVEIEVDAVLTTPPERPPRQNAH